MPEFAALSQHAQQARHWQLTSLFAQDGQRFRHFSVEAAGLFLDFSKNHIDADTLALLSAFARARQLEQRRDAMFNGELINATEHRPALHILLRAPTEQRFVLDGKVLSNDVQQVLDRMETLVEKIRNGEWRGHSGKPITDVRSEEPRLNSSHT